MTEILTDPKVPIYPAYCHRLSATNSGQVWCPLFATDIHRLRQEGGYEGQNIYFHINHPVKFVHLAAVIVDVNLFGHTGSGRRIVITVDDSSGKTIDALIKLPPSPRVENGNIQTTTGVLSPEEEAKASFPEFDFENLDSNIGKTVVIKGILDMFRGGMQILLRRYSVLRDSNAEVRFWSKVTQFRKRVWDKPWVLREEQIKWCREEKEKDERKEERKEERREERRSRRPKRKVLEENPKRPVLENGSGKKVLEEKTAKASRLQNWTCPWKTCGKNNPPGRTSCAYCFLPFEAGNKPIQTPKDLQALVWAGDENRFQAKPGVWTCLSKNCGNTNSLDRTSCIRCGLPLGNKPSKIPEDLPVKLWAGEESKLDLDNDLGNLTCSSETCGILLGASDKSTKDPSTGEESEHQNSSAEWTCQSRTCGTSNSSNRTSCVSCDLPIGRNKPMKQPMDFTAQGPQPGDWPCSSCGKNNYAANTECFSCYSSHPSSEHSKKNGDWQCPSCGKNNWAKNMECFVCSSIRPSPEPTKKFPVLGGDWTCPSCGKHNWAKRTECIESNCRYPRPSNNIPKKATEKYSPRADEELIKRSKPWTGDIQAQTHKPDETTNIKIEFKSGDWICPSNTCNEHNFAKKKFCFRCGTARPVRMKPGDWICPSETCGEHIFAKKKSCFKCGTARVLVPIKSGDWICPLEACSFINHAAVTRCAKCRKTSRFDVGGGV